jgi:hypothetical protein
MKSLKNYGFRYISAILVTLISCNKSSDTTTDTGNNGGGDNNRNCVISAVSQANNGSRTESSLSAFYNSNYEVTKIVVYDSVHQSKNFEASFNYITADSVRINQFQYMIRDANKRVIRFATKSNASDPQHADDYLFEYSYSSDGFLTAKSLFINGSKTANFSTTYSYTNSQLTSCIMTSPVSGNLKVLEASLSYDNSVTIKN